ncbi:HdeD family acid-resistance protein [Nocardia sp. NBC_00416]|uniref:HdeD family acid-resistance protein n=1 Tax=Nocardia sp. NBC_00416 TaxID=2975991 RepID=UPI002E1DA124
MISSDVHYEGPLHQLARRAWQAMLIIGLVSVVVGVVVLIWPGPTIVVLAVLFGIYLLVSGIFQLVAAFGGHVSSGWRVMLIVSAVLSFILAFFALRHLGDAVLLMALWIGIGWMFRGVAVLVAAADAPSGTPGRAWNVFFGIVLLIGGGMLIVWPFNSVAVLTVVAGWWLIFMGIVEVVGAFQVRGGAKNTPSVA